MVIFLKGFEKFLPIYHQSHVFSGQGLNILTLHTPFKIPLHSVQCVLYTVPVHPSYTCHTVHCTMFTLQCTLYTVNFMSLLQQFQGRSNVFGVCLLLSSATDHSYSALICTVNFILSILQCVYYTVYLSLCILHCISYIVYHTLCIFKCVYYTVYILLCILPYVSYTLYIKLCILYCVSYTVYFTLCIL